MKRIIAFVFLGILIYAGIYVAVYGIREYYVSQDVPITLEMPLGNGLTIKDSVSEQFGKIRKKTNQAKLFGIPIAEETTTYYYAIAIGDHPDYLLLAVTKPEDIEALENVSKNREFSFTGVLQEMDNLNYVTMIDYLSSHPDLIGLETSLYIVQTTVTSHISKYVIYVRDIDEPDAVPIIAGAAMILVGAGLAALLTVKIVRERTGY